MVLRNFAGLSLALVLGCNEVSQDSDGDTEEVVFTGPLEIIVPPDEDGNLPPDLWVSCRSGPDFQISDLEEIVPLTEGDPGGVRDAIEPFLSGEEGQFWPQEGWLILRDAANEILLVHPGTDGLSFMEVNRRGDEWAWSGAQGGAQCPLYYVTPEGLSTVDWRLDPEAPPDAGATTLSVLVTERDCVGGQEIGDRLLGPQVVLTEDTLRIAFAAQPPSGDLFTCPGNPTTQVIVDLPEPLGDREIIEGLAIGIDLEDYLP